MTTSLEQAFDALLRNRCTIGLPAEIANPVSALGTAQELPSDIRRLLAVQDGEDGMKTYSLGYRFMSEREILESIENIRTMVEDDETLPPPFLSFVPFIHTACKTDVGLFTHSGALGGSVVEYHYETGELTVLAIDVHQLLSRLTDTTELQLGTEFPAPGMSAVDIQSVFPWQPD